MLREVHAQMQETDSVKLTVTLEDALHTLRAHLPEICQRYQAKSLGIFGSFVRGEEIETSDIDILVKFQSPPTFFRFIEMEDCLSQLLGVRVDLVMKSALKPRIGERVLSEVVSV